MIALVLGAAALGFFAFRHHRRYHHACAGHGYVRWGGPPWAAPSDDVPPWDAVGGPGHDGGYHRGRHRGRRHGWGRRAMLHGLFVRLDATPGQEKLIQAELEQLVTLAREQRGRWKDGRREVAELLRADSLDAVALDAVLDQHQQGLDAVRAAAVAAVGRIHAALDDRQRARLADLIADGPGRGFGRFAGPYR